MTTTRGFTVGEGTGWRMRALRIIRWRKRHGTAPWLTVHGLESGCLPEPSGKSRRGHQWQKISVGKRDAGSEPGAFRRGLERSPTRRGAYRKARVPMVFWI